MKAIILVSLLLGINLAKADTSYSPSISVSSEKTLKLIPTYGVSTIITDYENYNSSINAGVALEKMLASRFSLGLVFNYASFKFNNSYNYGNYNYGYYNYGYSNLYNSYGQNIKSEILSLGINSKFFIIDDGMLRPFLGAGVNYNRNNLSYDYQYSSYYNYGNNTETINSFSGLLMAGTELRFSQNFGLNFDFRYIRTLGDNYDYNTYYSNYALHNLGRAILDSDLMSLNIGLLIAI